MSDGPTICQFCGSTSVDIFTRWGGPTGWCRSCGAQWNGGQWILYTDEDAGDDYRLSSATRKEWAERALKAEELCEGLIEELREARMQSLSDAGQAQEAYERQLELEAERDRLREALNAVCAVTTDVWASEIARAALNTEGDT